MKVVIVHNHLFISGVTKFCYTLAKLLKKNGHEVDFLIENMSNANSDVVAEISKVCNISLKPDLDKNYDVAFYNYNNSFETYNKVIKAKKKKFFVHGLELPEYRPPTNDVDEIFTFGERAFDFYKKRGLKTTLIRNFISDNDNQYNESSKDLKKVLLFAARDCSFLSDVLLQICGKNNWYFRTLGYNSYNTPVFDCKTIISESDLVIGVGRCMFEAMALGKPVVNFGINGGDGYVSGEASFLNMCITNGSGYTNNLIKTPFSDHFAKCQLEAEMKKYNKNDGEVNYNLIKKHYIADIFYNKIIE